MDSLGVQDPSKLPALLMGETKEEYKQKYGMYINPVKDRAKYSHIQGKEQIRIWVDGVFDLFHFGHIRYILQAKNMFPNTYVIAGVSGGDDVSKLKGMAVMTEEERCESVRQCKYVDEVICPAPWVLTKEFLTKHNIDFVAQNDTPYPMGDIPDIYRPIKDAGMFLPVRRTEEVSTSDFITRIILEYDKYLQRNLDRGYTRQDLGITYIKEKRLRVARKVEGVQKTINGLMAGFMEYFYQPISMRISEMVSPVPSPSHSPYYSSDEGEEEEEEPRSSKRRKSLNQD